MNSNKRILLACAFRYALGRMTYVVGAVAEEIEESWGELPLGQRKKYHEEIKEAIEQGHAGMDMDVRQWERILKLPLYDSPKTNKENKDAN